MDDLAGGAVRYAPLLTADLSRLASADDFPEVIAFDADGATQGALTLADGAHVGPSCSRSVTAGRALRRRT